MLTLLRSSLPFAGLMLSASLSAQIQLYTASGVDGLHGATRSGFVDALTDLGSKHYDSLEWMAPGPTSFRFVTHGGETMSIEHYEDLGWPLTVPRNFEVNSPIPGNRGITSKYGSTASRDLFSFDCLPMVAHWGAHLHDFESVASDPGILRAYGLSGQLLYEGDVVFPSGEDGDQTVNFVGIISETPNIATVTLSVGNSAAQVANGNANNENLHWSAFLDLRYGTATRRHFKASAVAATQLRATATQNNILGSGTVISAFPPGTNLSNGLTLVATSGTTSARSQFTLTESPGRVVYEITERTALYSSIDSSATGLHSTLLELAGNDTVGTNLRVEYWYTKSHPSAPSYPQPAASVDIGNDGTTEWTHSGPAVWNASAPNLPASILVTTGLDYPQFGAFLALNYWAEMKVRITYEYERQGLLYDNGPFVTHPGAGAGTADVSAVQNVFPLLHTVSGFGASMTSLTGTALADDFTVCGSPMTVNEVELFVYDVNAFATTAPVSTVRAAIYGADPALGGQPVAGSPGLNVVLPVVAQEWTGAYRVPTTNFSDTAKPIFRVRAALPSAITLPIGTYWLVFSTNAVSGSSAKVPSITVVDKNVTGNARVLDWLTWKDAETGLTPAAQGIPFRLHGVLHEPAGAIERTTPGCTGARLDVEGAPVLGGFLHAELVDPTPGTLGFIGVGVSAANQAFCGCTLGHDFTALLFGNQYELDIPSVPSLCGTTVYVQGLEFGLGGCPGLPIVLTETIKATIR